MNRCSALFGLNVFGLQLFGAFFLLNTKIVQAAKAPDLTAPGAIDALKIEETYNLGPTGMRGWIHIGRDNELPYGDMGLMTEFSRQILVSTVSAPAADAKIQVKDLIIGAAWGPSTDAVPLFSSDARKALGNAIGEAEKEVNKGILRLKIWRAGTTFDVNITLPTMGAGYSETMPYQCPKSAQILANARDYLVKALLAKPNYLKQNSYASPITALALLSAVTPEHPHYAEVQARLQSYAREMAQTAPKTVGMGTWTLAYTGIFLAEYYGCTGDASVLPGIQQYSLLIAQSQSMYGTFGHGPGMARPDGTGRISVAGYGPVNLAGLGTNLALVMGKKALVAGKQPVDPQIEAAIQRAANFFGWYVNKGAIPYGEHLPVLLYHASNGKDQLAAAFFNQLGNPVATEYFTRLSIAGFPGREFGHTGQGFSYLWEGMAANIGGPHAAAEYFKKVQWHLDLARRSDGSFTYDGTEQYGGGGTSDGTYLGASGYYEISPTASYVMTFSLPLKRLFITGKQANPANELSKEKVSNAIRAATYVLDRPKRTITQLIEDTGEFDPIVRNFAALELAKRKPSSEELATLRSKLTGPELNARLGAMQALGLLKDKEAMPLIAQRLSKNVEPDLWARASAAVALRPYGPDAAPHLDALTP